MILGITVAMIPNISKAVPDFHILENGIVFNVEKWYKFRAIPDPGITMTVIVALNITNGAGMYKERPGPSHA